MVKKYANEFKVMFGGLAAAGTSKMLALALIT
jgi:hypothetical protein